MSDIGLNAGLYQYTRTMAELVDSVLIEIKTKQDKTVSLERKRLGEILLVLPSKKWLNLDSRLLALMVKDIPGIREREWQEVGQALLSGRVDENMVVTLERLAQALEREQLEATSRIRG